MKKTDVGDWKYVLVMTKFDCRMKAKCTSSGIS